MLHTPARTLFAQRAMTLGDYLTEHFRMSIIAGVGGPGRGVRFIAPEVETTGGGKQARQIVQLVRRGGAEPPVVCGFIDIGIGDAQMRGFDALESLQAERQGTPLALSRSSYEEFLSELAECLSNHNISLRVNNEVTSTRNAVVEPAPRAAEAASSVALPQVQLPALDVTLREWAMLGAGIAAGLVLGALLWSPASPF